MPLDAPQAPGQQSGPWVPPGPEPLRFDSFEGMNTKPSRPGVDEKECFWIDGFMPFGKNNLRAMWGVGDSVYKIEDGLTIVAFDFGNIGSVPYCVVLRSDGAIDAINLQTNVEVNVLPAGAIQNPAVGEWGLSQWGSKYLLFVADQPNGYWLWDGTNVFTAGTLGPVVTVTNPGQNYTSQPTIAVAGGTGSGATFTATLENGAISEINVTNPGSGYLVTDQDMVVTIQGGGSDNSAKATATIDTTAGISGVVVTNGGAGYTAQTTIVLTGGGGGTGFSASINAQNGTVTGFTIINPGHGFTSPPAISLNDPATPHGSGFAGYTEIAFGGIASIAVSDGGSGYTSTPIVTIVGDGTGATAVAQIAGGAVTAINVVNPGNGYTQAEVQISGGNNAADATVSLMPFGVKGTAIETYVSRVWITDGPKFLFTAAESVTDFAATDGGGVQQSFDSFLRVSFTKPLQTNGFLYLIADSSINYISGVSTTVNNASGLATTTYTNQNADPEIGTAWPDTIDVFSRNIVLANLFGVHVSYGGAVTKVSDQLDGVYSSVPFFGSFTPSACKAIHFGIKIWCLLLPIIDPITNVRVNKLLCWDGKRWWAASQDFPLIFVQHQELNSIITAYGTDGINIRPLFARPSTGFKKIVQSKLWEEPGGYHLNKTASRLWALAQYYDNLAPEISVTIDAVDDQTGDTTQVYTLTPTVPVPGAYVSQPQAIGQQGELTGVTIETYAADMSLVSVMMTDVAWNYRG